MKQYLALMVLLALMPAVATATDEEAYNRRAVQRNLAMLHDYDYNQDGLLSRDEAQGIIDLQAAFADIDINADGFITAEEMHRYVDANYPVAASGMDGAAPTAVRDNVPASPVTPPPAIGTPVTGMK